MDIDRLATRAADLIGGPDAEGKSKHERAVLVLREVVRKCAEVARANATRERLELDRASAAARQYIDGGRLVLCVSNRVGAHERDESDILALIGETPEES